MDLKEFKEFLLANKDDQNVIAAIKEVVVVRVEKSDVENYLSSKEGAADKQSILDTHFNNSLATWKANHLTKEEEKLRKELTNELRPPKDARDERIRELERKFKEKEDDERVYKQLLSAKDQLKSSAFAGLIDHLVDKDENITRMRMDILNEAAEMFKRELNAESVRGSVRTPAGSSNYNSSNNPFDRKSPAYSLTECGRLYRENPEEAKRLQSLVN